MTDDRGGSLARVSAAPIPRRSRLGDALALLTRSGQERLAQENRLREGLKLQETSAAMTIRTGERLDSMRTGTPYADEVINDAMGQSAVMRSGSGADYMRRTSR